MITYDELTGEHKFDPDSVRQVLDLAWDSDRLFLYRNNMFDSSKFGRQHLMLAGPGRSAADPDNPPREIDPDNTGGLPSHREQLIGEVDLDDVRKNFRDDKTPTECVNPELG